MNPTVDKYLSGVGKWQDELKKLRRIILDCDLTEELKWGAPCYTFQGANVVIIMGFKVYCALSFFKGALLEDANGILAELGGNTRAVRVIRFTDLRDIVKLESTLKCYIYEAIEVQRAGLKVKVRKPQSPRVPDEFQQKLDKDPALRTAFYALTPGRQRAYLLYFSAAKQSKTRESRVQKCIRHILHGMGLETLHLKKK